MKEWDEINENSIVYAIESLESRWQNQNWKPLTTDLSLKTDPKVYPLLNKSLLRQYSIIDSIITFEEKNMNKLEDPRVINNWIEIFEEFRANETIKIWSKFRVYWSTSFSFCKWS